MSKTRNGDAFPPWAYTAFSNATLEAMMHPDESPRQRFFACVVRHSWGYDSLFAIRPHTWRREEREAATQIDLARLCHMSTTHAGNVATALAADGWISIEDGQIIPNPKPTGRPPVNPTPEPAEVYPELPTRQAFRELEDPSLAKDRKEALTRWNEVRRREHALDEKYEAMVDAFIASRSASGDDGESTVQTSVQPPYSGKKAAVQPRILTTRQPTSSVPATSSTAMADTPRAETTAMGYAHKDSAIPIPLPPDKPAAEPRVRPEPEPSKMGAEQSRDQDAATPSYVAELYVSQVRTIALEIGIPLRQADVATATDWHRRQIPIAKVRHALFLGAQRHLMPAARGAALAPIQSLAFFEQVLLDVIALDPDPGDAYWQHVEWRFRTDRKRVERGDFKKKTVGGDV